MLENFSKDIMITQQTKDAVTFRTACGCHCDEHDVTIDIEFDKKWQLVSMLFYKKVSLRSYTHKDYYFRGVIKEVLKFFHLRDDYIDTIDWWLIGVEGTLNRIRDYCKRISLAAKLLWTGWIEMDEGFTFKGEDHIRNFTTAINQGLSYVTRGNDKDTYPDFKCLSGKVISSITKSSNRTLFLNFDDGTSLSINGTPLLTKIIPGIRILDVVESKEPGMVELVFDQSLQIPVEDMQYNTDTPRKG